MQDQGGYYVGGLVGTNYSVISNSYASAQVSGGNDGIGGLAGRNFSGGSIIRSYATGTASSAVAGASNIGGLAGTNLGSIADSYATGTVSGANSVGGLVGRADTGTVSSSYATGSVSGANYAGGLVGYSAVTVSNSYATGAVTGSGGGYDTGGLIGQSIGTVSDSYATGNVFGISRVGGLIGNNNAGGIGNSYATGAVQGTGNSLGGLAGYSSGNIGSSHATGSVTGPTYVGGLVGYNAAAVSNSYATGSVTGSSADAGGLIGQNAIAGSANNTYATGSVIGVSRVGGLVGNNTDGSVSNSYSSGTVSGTGNTQGGLIGFASGTVSNSYATGSVTGVTYVGGLVAYSLNATITNGYASGNISGSGSYIGGVLGYRDSGTSISNTYWNLAGNAAGVGSGATTGTTSLTTAQMQSAANFTGFAFTTTTGATGNNWVMVNGDGSLNGSTSGGTYPMLASEYSTTIDNTHQLQLMAMALASSYSLGRSVDAAKTVNGTDVWGTAGFVPVGNAATRFTGTFDGQNYTIGNLTINRPASENVGLIGAANAAVVRNVGLVSANVTGLNNVGTLLGFNELGTITNSYATGSLTSSGQNIGGLIGWSNGTITSSHAEVGVSGSGGFVGGLVGVNVNGGTVSNSYATGSVAGADIVGGLVGINWTAATNYSYALGSVSASGNAGNGRAGGLAGQNYSNGTIGTSYAAGSVVGNDSSNRVGGLVGWNESGTLTDNHWNSDVKAVGVGSGAPGSSTGLTTTQMQSASNFTGFTFTTSTGITGNNWVMVNGDGSLNGTATGGTYPMLAAEYSATINNAHQLQLMRMGLSASYTLGMDISAARTASSTDVWGSAGFVPIGNSTTPFTGTFDGLGHVVSSLAIDNAAATRVGLFGVASGSTNGYIRNVGLTNVAIAGSHTSSNTGALVGQNTATISNAYSTGTVTGGGTVGGLVGSNWSRMISDSYSSAAVSGSNAAGGAAGGLVGVNNDGGFLINTHATGNVTGSSYMTGGLVGNNTSNGYPQLTVITDSYATGNVTGSGSWVGGLAGGAAGAGYISNSYATGIVTGNGATGQFVGGLVGILQTRLSNVYATGNISASSTSTNIGGLVGAANTTASAITNAYSTGSVTASGASNVVIGGFIGSTADTIISNSYSTGAVTGGSHHGGFVGKVQTGTILNSFWNAQTSGQAYSENYNTAIAGLVGKTTSELRAQATFIPAGTAVRQWDFTNTWTIAEGTSYPTLRPAVLNSWTGSTSNLWGTASNWSLGHAPLANETVIVAGNGAAVDVAAAGAAARFLYVRDPFTLSNAASTLSVADQAGFNSTLTIANGTLTVDGALNTTTYAQSNGTVDGVGVFNVAGSFSKTGGSFGSTFTGVSITQASGDLNPGNMTINGPLTLTASTGTIDTTGSTLNVTGLATLVADKMNLAGSLTAGNVTLQNKTAADAINLGSTVDTTASTLEISQTEVGNITTSGLLTIGASNNSGAITVSQALTLGNATKLYNSTGGIAINGTINAGSHALTLYTSNGAVTQAAPITSSGLLTTYSYFGVNLDAANSVSSFTASNANYNVDIIFNNTGALNVAGISTASTSYNNKIQLTAGGAITQTGVITTGSTLITSSVGGTTLNLANAVGGFNATNTGTGAISLTNTATNLNITGIDQSASGAVAIHNSGSVTVSGTSTIASNLVMEYGQGAVALGNTATFTATAPITLPAGNTYSSKLGSNGTTDVYTVITGLGSAGSTTGTDLQGMQGNLWRKYALGSDIDASSTSTWNSGSGFVPVGNGVTAFGGRVEGLGHTISGLSINRSTTDYVGLIGYVGGAGSSINNLALVAASITGQNSVGALVGLGGTDTTIHNAWTSGSVSGTRYVGGLIGNKGGTVTSSHSDSIVSGSNEVGGLVGSNKGIVGNSIATGTVTGTGDYVGGLVGSTWYSAISNSYSSGNVSGATFVGGLVGGLVGGTGGGTMSIDNSYSTSAVNSINGWSGGLIGIHQSAVATISNSWSSGAITGSTSNAGGLVGNNSGIITNSFWDTETSGKSSSAGGTGLTTTQAMTQASYTGWDFANTWWIHANSGNTRPFLRSEYSTIITNAHQLQLMAMSTNSHLASYTLANDISMAELSNASGMWNASKGFVRIGDDSVAGYRFQGNFDGKGHVVDGLRINRPTESAVGLFGLVVGSNKTIRNLGLTNVDITGFGDVGALAGGGGYSSIDNVYSTGTVTGSSGAVGGLVGNDWGIPITNSWSAATVSNNSAGTAGGLVGSSATSLTNVHATGNVSGAGWVGGLAGLYEGTLSNAYATGSVSGAGTSAFMGGLVGFLNGAATVSNSYASGSVTGTGSSQLLGGLVGKFGSSGNATMTNVYANGNVTGVSGSMAGGLVGRMFAGSIDRAISAGTVSVSGGTAGGLAGIGFAVTNSYWNTQTSGQATTSGGGTGLTTAQMQSAANFANLTFTTTPGATGNNWVMVNGDGTLNGTTTGGTYPMLASEYSTTITNAHQLQLMSMNLAGSYTLGDNIDAAKTATGTDVWGSAGFVPVGYYSGSSTTQFTGTFNGMGHTVTGLAVNRPTSSHVALFGLAGTGSTISNVGLIGGGMTVGVNSAAGSLVAESYGTISNSYASGGTVIGGNDSDVGGLVGYNGGSISNSYANNSVSTGANGTAGGVAGFNAGTISDSYASGLISGSGNNGGLVGDNTGGTISQSFWNVASSNQADAYDGRGTGLTSVQMKQQDSFTGWNIARTGGAGTTWRIYEGNTAPLLTSFLTPLTLTGAPDATVTYNGTTRSGGSYALVSNVFGAAASSRNAGFYNGYYSTQQGYDISGGNLTITPASLTFSTANVTKTYDGGLTAAGTAVVSSGTVFGGDTFGGGTYAFIDKNAGSGNKTVTVGGVTVNDGNNGGNYTVGYTANTTSTITPKALTATVSAPSKTYDGNTGATPTLTITDGLVGSETVSATGSATFNSKDVATANLVTVTSTTLANGANGGLASNYSLASGETVAAGITQLAAVAWTGGSTGNWSTAANWAGGAVPDKANVAAVTIPANTSVTYDSGVDSSTFLNTLIISSGGGLTMAGSALAIGQSLTTPSYIQTGGTLTGAGNFTANGSFIKTGGSFTPGGTVNITQSSGNLVFSSEAAITFGTLTASNGNIDIDNTGGLTTTALVSAAGGYVHFTAHSPIAIGNGGIQAGTGVQLSATTASAGSTVAIDGAITSATGPVAVSAYGSITQNASITGDSIVLASSAGNIAIAPTAIDTVTTGGTIQVSAPAGTITSTASNFAGATPSLLSAAPATATTTTTTVLSNEIATAIQTALYIPPPVTTVAPIAEPVVPATTPPASVPVSSVPDAASAPTTGTSSEPVSSTSPAESTATTASSASNATNTAENKPKEDSPEDKPAPKPAIQTVTVANTTVQKPADQVVTSERPKGRALVCRGG